MAWHHFNTWYDGVHYIASFDTRQEAIDNVERFIGHLEYPQGDDMWASDDGDKCWIIESSLDETELRRMIQLNAKAETEGLSDHERDELFNLGGPSYH